MLVRVKFRTCKEDCTWGEWVLQPWEVVREYGHSGEGAQGNPLDSNEWSTVGSANKAAAKQARKKCKAIEGGE